VADEDPALDPVALFLKSVENIDLPDDLKASFVETLKVFKSLGADDLDGMTKHDPAEIEAEKARGEAEDVANDFLYAVIDQRGIKRLHRKWYNPNTTLGDRTGASRLTKKTGIGFHNTAVAGGFGAWKSIVAKHKKIALENHWVDNNGIMLPDGNMWSGWSVKPNKPLTVDEWARALGVGARYRGEPDADYNHGVSYQILEGANSVTYLNLPFDWVTWHGHALNTDYIGWAWDANSTKEKISEGLGKDLIYSVERTVDLARSEGHPIKFFNVHATTAPKPADPGVEFIREVLIPAAARTGCELVMDKASGGGRTLRDILKAA